MGLSAAGKEGALLVLFSRKREREQCPPQVSMVVEQLRLYDISQWNVPIRPSASAAAMLQNRSAVEGEISPVI